MLTKENYVRRSNAAVFGVATILLVLVFCGCKRAHSVKLSPLNEIDCRALDRESKAFEPALKAFFAAKKRQAESLAAKDTVAIHPDIWHYFGAAARGDWRE